MAVVHGTNNDFQVPSLDLRFADRKNLVDTISGEDLITFTRNSVGTYVDANGVIQTATNGVPRFDHDPVTGESLGLLIEEARTNAVNRSSDFQTDWTNTNVSVVPNRATAPDGTLTATSIVDDSTSGEHKVSRSAYVSVPLARNTLTVFVKPNGLTTFELGTTSSSHLVRFTLTGDGTATPLTGSTTPAGGGEVFIEKLANGWYRCGFQASYVVTITYPYIRLYNSGTSYVGNGSGIYVWGLQMENSALFPTSYIPTPATFTSRSTTATYYDANGIIQTAGVNVARDNTYLPDENGVMQPAGLLLEGSGTNQVLDSDTMVRGADGFAINLTFTADVTTAPDGVSASADLVVPTTTSGNHQIYKSLPDYTGTSGTLSLFVKANGYTKVIINAGTNSSGYTAFDISGNGSFLYKGSDVVAHSIQKLGNGWFRISTTNAAHTNAYRYQVLISDPSYTTGNPSEWSGDGTSGMYVWGLQFEAGSFPTSYIPTTSSTVTRSADVYSSSTVTRAADVASITGSNFSSWYNQSESAILAAGTARSISIDNQFLACISDNTDSNFFGITRSYLNNITDVGSGMFTSGSPQLSGLTEPIGSWPFGEQRRIAASYKSNDCAFCFAGNSAKTDVTATLPTVTQLRIGGANQITPAPFNGTISRLTYFPTRLSNALLQKLTK